MEARKTGGSRPVLPSLGGPDERVGGRAWARNLRTSASRSPAPAMVQLDDSISSETTEDMILQELKKVTKNGFQRSYTTHEINEKIVNLTL